MRDEPAAIHLMSFNVCGLPSPLAPLAERATRFCEYIEASDLDVVNFQEVWWRSALEALKTRLPSFRYLAWRRGLAGQPRGGLVTFSRRPLDTIRYTSFRGTRPDQGSPKFRLKRIVNGMLQGVLTSEVTGLGAVVANTHLTANKDGDWSAGNRYHVFQRAQLAVLHAELDRARSGSAAVIVSGDFNIASESPLYPMIVRDGAWRDPFAASNPVTFHAEFLPPGSTAHRIDYVLVAGDASVADTAPVFAEPVTLPDGGRMYLSDHVALTARLELSAGRR